MGLNRRTQDRLAQKSVGLLTMAVGLLVPLVALALLLRAWPILATKPLGELLFSTTWRPFQGAFGLYPSSWGRCG